MSSSAANMQTSQTVKTWIKYVKKGEKTIFYPGDREKSYWPGEDHDVLVTDLHSLTPEQMPTVEKNGFTLLRHQTRMTDYHDQHQLDTIFYPEMCELAKQVNGATKSIAFGHVARDDSAGARQHLQPAFAAHVDYGRFTVEEYTRNILGEEADKWLEKRVILMNFWRPIKTVYRSPLALCDASSLGEDDLWEAEVRGGLDDPNRPPLYGWNLSYNPNHRWYYASEMQPEEIFAFKLYDSREDVPRFTGHTAIELPGTDENTPPRNSMEIRTISFVDE